jgi:uncharacterized protein YeaO (DUF488 family)
MKRVYESPQSGDGVRVLVDRLWPRGLSKEKARVDIWLKELAPSHGLRTWFGHDPAKWEAFRRQYLAELNEKSKLLQTLAHLERERKTMTLVYAASDEAHNNAVVLAEWLRVQCIRTATRRKNETDLFNRFPLRGSYANGPLLRGRHGGDCQRSQWSV